MLDMPRNLPPHLHREITRHGRIVYYVRKDKKKRTRIKAEYGTPEFDAAYRAALTGDMPPDAGVGAKGTLQWLVTMYRDSRSWLDLSMATRRQRENILKHVLASGGREPFSHITQEIIEAGRDRRVDKTPHQARHFVDTMKGLFAWAKAKKLVKVDPAAGVKAPAKPKSEGFLPWNDNDVKAFEKRWPLGTRERLLFEIYFCTGLRRGDVTALGKQHVKNGFIVIDTEKTGTRVEIPILRDLQRAIDASPVGDLSYMASKKGLPMKKESVGNFFRDACRAAGITKSGHGLRKTAATRAANNGATEAELEAIFGWVGGRMASHYTRTANRRRLASGAMKKLARKG